MTPNLTIMVMAFVLKTRLKPNKVRYKTRLRGRLELFLKDQPLFIVKLKPVAIIVAIIFEVVRFK
jgi:hypothetical protein